LADPAPIPRRAENFAHVFSFSITPLYSIRCIFVYSEIDTIENPTAGKIAMNTHELIIEGMSCGHCVMHVKKELSKVENLVIENVEIGKARIQYDETKVTQEQVAEAISAAGYDLVALK
jgi:copper chaperone